MQSTKRGQMVAVFAAEEEVLPVCASLSLSIAAINGPQLTVISGPVRAVEAAVRLLEAAEIRTKALNVSHAFHSSLMDPILEPFRAVASQVTFHAPQIALIGNTAGDLAGQEVTSPDYWARHIRSAVRFADGMDTLYRMGIETFVEIGPQPILLGMGRRGLPDEYGTWLPTLRQGSGQALHQGLEAWGQMFSSVAQLYVRGVEIDWRRVAQDYIMPSARPAASHKLMLRDEVVVLPTYPFQRERYWVEPRTDAKRVARESRPSAEHPLLQKRLYSATLKKGQIQFEAQLSATMPDYLAEHRLFGEAILPASAYLEMVLAACQASQLLQKASITLSEVVIEQALRLDEPQTVQVLLTPDEEATLDAPAGYAWTIFISACC